MHLHISILLLFLIFIVETIRNVPCFYPFALLSLTPTHLFLTFCPIEICKMKFYSNKKVQFMIPDEPTFRDNSYVAVLQISLSAINCLISFSNLPLCNIYKSWYSSTILKEKLRNSYIGHFFKRRTFFLKKSKLSL